MPTMGARDYLASALGADVTPEIPPLPGITAPPMGGGAMPPGGAGMPPGGAGVMPDGSQPPPPDIGMMGDFDMPDMEMDTLPPPISASGARLREAVYEDGTIWTPPPASDIEGSLP